MLQLNGALQDLNDLYFFAAVVEATEEAVLNALVAARDLTGRDGHTSYALPHEEVRRAFAAA